MTLRKLIKSQKQIVIIIIISIALENDSEFFNEDSKSLSDISQKKDGSSTGKESKIFELEDKNSDNNILASSMHINKLSQKRTSSRQSSFHLSNLSSSKDSNYRRVSRNWQSNKVSYFL